MKRHPHLLSPAAMIAFDAMRAAITQACSVAELRRMAETGRPLTALDGFPYLYAGILLARQERLTDAMTCLRLVPPHPFITLLIEYIEQYQAFSSSTPLFQDPAIYDVHNQTVFYRTYLPSTMGAVCDFVRTVPLPSAGMATIMDIGPGNGYLLAEILRTLTAQHGLKKLTCILIEPSRAMLERCIDHCRQQVTVPLECLGIQAAIERVPPQEWERIHAASPIWFINASGSLHHLPRDQKGPILRQLQCVAAPLLLSEFDAAIDVPERDSPQLVYSVANYMMPHFASVYEDERLSTVQRLALLRQYYLVEALHMLTKPRAERGDYQATADEWRAILKAVDGVVANERDTVCMGGQRITFSFHVNFPRPR